MRVICYISTTIVCVSSEEILAKKNRKEYSNNILVILVFLVTMCMTGSKVAWVFNIHYVNIVFCFVFP